MTMTQRMLVLWRTVTGSGPEHDPLVQKRIQMGIGVAGVLVSAVALLAAAVVYVFPPGQHTYHVDLGNASGVRAGDQVRIAGIQVGKVSSVKLAGDHVHVAFTVKDSVHVGEQSSIAVKMLTPVGGRFLMLTSLGAHRLAADIPTDRTTGTYDLTAVFEQAVPTLRDIDGAALRGTIDEVDAAMRGQPDAVRELLGSSGTLLNTVSQRAPQLQQALSLSQEYLRATNGEKAVLLTMVKNLGVLGVKLGTRRVQVVGAFNLLNRFFALIDRPVMAYADKLEQPIRDAYDTFTKLQARAGTIDDAIAAIQQLINVVATGTGVGQGLVVDQSRITVSGVQLCIPNTSRNC